jgi:RNA polymerase sigma-70 factor, ECF subfamily
MDISAEIYDFNRRFLWGICYRMTGNAAEADDIVQETFVRALEKPKLEKPGLEKPASTQEETLRPWLVRVAMNLCRDYLRRRRRSGYVGPWLPSPVPTGEQDSSIEFVAAPEELLPTVRYDLLESVSIAFLLALEALTPSQRAVLLLRDVFDYSTTETAGTLQMSETTVKVTLHRARRVMLNYDKERTRPDPARREMTGQTLKRFLEYLQMGDLGGLERLLSEDVLLVSDGGGEVVALLEPMRGRERVLRLLTKLNDLYRDSTLNSLYFLNGLPAILFQRSAVREGHALRFTLQCEIDEAGSIRRLNFVFAPGKLTALK